MLPLYTPLLALDGKALGLNTPAATRPRLKLHWMTDRAPWSPDKVDHLQGWGFEMGMNNRFGTCGPTAVSNSRDMTSYLLSDREENAPIESVFDLYRRSGSPSFDPRTGRGDNGVTMDALCDACEKGGFNGHRAIGYAALADQTDPSVQAAIHAFGGVLFAVDLQTAQSGQTDQGFWDYQRSPQWGGHAILAGAYDREAARIDVVTWQKRIYTTAAFRRVQLSEVWVVLWEELVTSQRFFDSGVDLAELVADYQALTGRSFPVPVPPPTPPPPPPPPNGGSICIDPAARTYRFPPGWSPAT